MRHTDTTTKLRPAHRSPNPRGARLLLVLVAALIAFCLFVSNASAAGESNYDLVKAFGPDGTGATNFDGGAAAVAVDRGAGVVYVLDRKESLFKFDLQGNPVDFGGLNPAVSGNRLTGLPLGFGNNLKMAVNPVTHTIYFTAESSGAFTPVVLAFKPNGEPSLFTAGPGAGTNSISAAPLTFRAVYADASGAIWLTYRGAFNEPGRTSILAPSGAEILPSINGGEGGSEEQSTELFVDGSGNLYSTIFDYEVRKRILSEFPVTPTTTFGPSIAQTPVGPSGYTAFNQESNELYFVRGGPAAKVDVYDSNLKLVGSFAGSGESGRLGESPTGIAVDPGTERVLVSESGFNGSSAQIKIFEPHRCVCPPAIERTSVSEVTGDSANLHARVNPNTFETTYWFEYGLEDCALGSCTKAPLSGAQIAADFKPVTVTRSLTGLQPHATYHYRVVAENAKTAEEEIAPTEGPEKTFTTQGSGLGFKLSDSRVWEMVSPSDKHGGSISLYSSGLIQAAEDGDGLAYLTLGSIEADPLGNRAVESASVLARRGDQGWHSTDITPPHAALTRPRDGEYRLMSPDLSSSLLEVYDDAPLSPLTTEATPYLRQNSEPPLYTPLLTAAPGHANVAPGTVFGSDDGVEVEGASADLSTFVVNSPTPLLEGESSGGTYIWRDGQLQRADGGLLGSGVGSIRNAISADGSRAFVGNVSYLSDVIGTGPLTLQDTATEESTRLDIPQPGASGGGAPRPVFQIASADGTAVFFTDSRHLTKGASPEGRDLYRCEIPPGQSAGGCATLTDISAPRKGSGESSQVQNMVPAVSEDGSRVYFVAEGVLDLEPNASGETAVAKQPNLYLSEAGEGVRFIATLSKDDWPDWGATRTLVNGYASGIAADASPSGRYLAFMSSRSLTGADNQTADGDPAVQAFLYDAASDELTCVSCNPTGAIPRAQVLPDSGGKVDPGPLWAGQPLAATLAGPRGASTAGSVLYSYYRPRTVLDNGRLFFNAYDSLVPADSNGNWDVYQYESTETGSCTASSGDAATVRSAGGCVSLLSSGTAEEEAAFLDASLDGNDVFFLSTAKLSLTDEDAVYDVYDARVDGVAARLPDLAECQGEACQPQASAPDDPTPASAAFHGAGNVTEPTPKRCPKGKHRANRGGKTVCVAKKKHRKQRRHRAHKVRRAAR